MPTPFEPFKNAVIRFRVEDPTLPDTTDSAGNPIPASKEITIEAFLKPSSAQYQSAGLRDQFPGLGVNTIQVQGYITSDNGVLPSGINPGDRSSYCKYRDQEGTFIFLLNLQSSVGADSITGAQIRGLMQVLGGQ